VIRLFEKDNQTKVVVLIGEIGGNAEELAVQYIKTNGYSKPIIAYVAGRSAPPEKRMGHAGAIVLDNLGTARSKIEAFASVGINVAKKPSDIVNILHDVL
jgi:succinyl-CoA synthetase alpha subunit